MRLRQSSNLVSALLMLMLAIAFVAVITTFELAQQRRDALITMHEASDALNHMQEGSQTLMLAAQAYVSSLDERYYNAYMTEKNDTRRREKAVEEFLALSLASQTTAGMLEAKRQSDLLTDMELRALDMVRSGDRERANNLLHSDAYEAVKSRTISPLVALEQQTHQQFSAVVARLNDEVNLAMAVTMGLLGSSLIMILLVMRNFYYRKVLKPLADLTEKTNQLNKGERELPYAYVTDQTEIGDLSRALKSYQENMVELDAQREQLRQAEAWYRQIIEFSPDGMLIVDSNGTIQIANPKAHELFGYSPGSLNGICVDTLVPTVIQPHHAALRARFMDPQGGYSTNSINGDFRALHKNGHEFPVELGLTRLPQREGHLASACATIRDLTSRKRAEKIISDQLDFQHVLLDSLPYPIFFKDKFGCYQGFNQAFLDLFNLKREDLLGKTVTQFGLLSAEDRSMFQQANEQILKQGGRFSIETTLHLPDNRQMPIIYNLSSFGSQTGEVSGLVGTLVDISVQKEAALTLSRAKELAEETTQLKSNFLANMSHEIRTPMNVIMGMAHLALDSHPDKRLRHYLETINRAAQGLLGIINDILDFSKIEAGKMHIEEIDFYMEDVLGNLIDLATARAQEKGLELLFDIGTDLPTALIGDPLRLGQILNNLLSNAIKFTEHGEITVSIRLERSTPQQTWFRFEVSDTGIGMDDAQQSRLFQAFSQADSSTSRKYGGTGLGLSICQQLVILMGGTIGVDSEKGIGSTFYFSLPFRLQSRQRSLEIHGDDILNMPILVVDDNASAREILQSMLVSMKFQARTASSAEDAIKQLEAAAEANQPFRLVIMDWMMPGVDGVDAVRHIRANQKISLTPLFIMVTAYNRDELREKLGEMHIEDVMIKPVTPSTLLDTILNRFGKQAISRPRKRELQSQTEEARKALQGAYLLLVEDNQTNQEMTTEILGRAGVRVDVANNGAEALAMVTRHNYDGILMDCQMPVMDGFEATRRIRALPQFAQLPILAMTANAMTSDKEQCLAAGMNDHIAKPVDVDQLFITLARWVSAGSPNASNRPLTESAPVTLPQIPGLQLDIALQRLGGNSGLLCKLLQRFCENQADAVHKTRQAIASNALETAVREIHTLKGQAGNIGARQLSMQAADLEAQLKHHPAEVTDAMLDDVESTLITVVADIERGLDSLSLPTVAVANTSAPADPASIQQLREDLVQLHQLLLEDDGGAAHYLDSLQAELQRHGFAADAQQLHQLIGQYQFDDALEAIQHLQQRLTPQ